MALIPFPDIPALPGVPSLPRLPNISGLASGGALVKTLLGAAQGLLWKVLQTRTQWGVLDARGRHLADPSMFQGLLGTLIEGAGFGPTLSTNSVEYSKETRISDFPIEGGGFASYNKVEMPGNPVVTLVMGGSEGARSAFLAAIEGACKSTELYSVVTPEKTYPKHSIERYSYQRRSDRGATLLMVELVLKEVRQVSATYTKAAPEPKQPAAKPALDLGKIQAKLPDVSTAKALVDKVPGLLGTATNALKGVLR